MTTAEAHAAAEGILFPETKEPHQYAIADRTIALRPLPIKHARILGAKVKPFEEFLKAEGISALDALTQAADVFIDAACHLISFYGIEGAGKEWVEEHMTSDDVRDFIAAQLELQRREDFLLLPLRLLSEQMQTATHNLLSAPVVVAPETAAVETAPVTETAPSLNSPSI